MNHYWTPLKFHQTLLRPWSILLKHPRVFLSLSALVVLPLLGILGGFVHAMQSSWTPGQFDMMAWIEQHSQTVAQICFLVTLVLITFGIAAQAAMLRAVAEIYASEQSAPSFGRTLGIGFRKVGPLLCYWFALFFGMLVISLAVGIVLAIVVALLTLLVSHNVVMVVSFILQVANVVVSVILSLILYVAEPVIVVEGKTWMQAMQRSYELTKGKLCFLFMACFLFSVVSWAFVTIYWFILAGFWSAENLMSVHGVVLLAAPYWVLFPITVIFDSVVYFHLRISKDGCNRATLVQELYGEESTSALYAPILSDGSEGGDDENGHQDVEAPPPVATDYEAPQADDIVSSVDEQPAPEDPLEATDETADAPTEAETTIV